VSGATRRPARRRGAAAGRSCAALAAVALAGCRPEPPAAAPPPGPGSPLIHTVSAKAGDPLASYRWNDGPPIPTAPGGFTGELRIDHGEAGATPETRLYWTFTGPDGFAPCVAPPGRATERGALGTEGRFGPGVALGDGTAELRFAPERAADALFDRPWTLELWLRPDDAGASGTVVRSPDGFELARDPDGRLRLQLEGAPPPLYSAHAVSPERWTHVGVAVDGPDHHARARLVVDGVLQDARELRDPGAGRGAELVLGGAGFAGRLDDLRVTARSANSAELEERFRSGAPAGPHRLQLDFASGPRTVELWAGVLATAVLDADEAWRTGERDHFDARDGRLRWMPGQWTRDHPPSPPRARTTHPTVFVGDHRAFLFSGEVRDSHVEGMLNTPDTWLYDLRARRWRSIDDPGRPPGRCHQDAAYSPDHGIVLYAAGWRNDRHGLFSYADTWVFHVEEERWEERRPTGDPLPEMNGNAVVYHPGIRRFLLFRGAAVYAYDPDADHWERRPRSELVDGATGEAVELRLGGSSMADYDPVGDRVILFGGAWVEPEGRQFHASTLDYDFAANRFTLRSPERAPSPRVRSGFSYDPLREWFVLFGGVQGQDSVREGDLWVYRADRDEWLELASADVPSRRGGYYGMAFDPVLDRFALLCGRHSKRRFLNEAWRLHLDPAAVGTARYVFDRAAFPEARTWFAEWTAPELAAVVFRFRGSPDGVAWSAWTDAPAETEVARARYVMLEIRAAAPGLEGTTEIARTGFARVAPQRTGDLRSLTHAFAPLD